MCQSAHARISRHRRSQVSSGSFTLHAFRVGKIRAATDIASIRWHLWEQLYLSTQLRRRLLWSPGNTGPIGVSRQVLTVHDAAALGHAEWFERKFALWYAALLPRLFRKVRATITVSHFSKERIVRLTGVAPSACTLYLTELTGVFVLRIPRHD